jgi:HlyD family secretion protein
MQRCMDREIDPVVRRRALQRRLLLGLGAVTALVALIVLLPRLLRPSVHRDGIRTAIVERGRVNGEIEASGTAVPAIEQVVSSPVEARVLRILKRAGEEVRAGDPIVELDTSASRLEADRLQDRLTQKENETRQARLDLGRTLAVLESRLATANLDLEISRYRLEQRRRLRADGLISEEALREAEVEARKAELACRQIDDEAGAAREANAARLATLDLDASILGKELAEAKRLLTLATAHAERDGVLTWTVSEVGATVGKGDLLARIADLSAFRIEATISDVHAAQVAAGLPARVLFADVALDGRVASVRPAVENGVLHFLVDLDQDHHPGLRKDLRVDVVVVTESHAGALKVKRGAFSQGGAVQQVFVVRGERALRVEARPGIAGREEQEVLEGLNEGDEVIVSDMRDLLPYAEVRVR